MDIFSSAVTMMIAGKVGLGGGDGRDGCAFIYGRRWLKDAGARIGDGRTKPGLGIPNWAGPRVMIRAQ